MSEMKLEISKQIPICLCHHFLTQRCLLVNNLIFYQKMFSVSRSPLPLFRGDCDLFFARNIKGRVCYFESLSWDLVTRASLYSGIII